MKSYSPLADMHRAVPSPPARTDQLQDKPSGHQSPTESHTPATRHFHYQRHLLVHQPRYPRVEIDSLHHGAGWTPRETFVADVDEFTAGPQWVIELQYREVRPLIVARADTLLWLDYPSRVQMRRLVYRTVSRRLLRRELWNGNYEPALHTFFTDEDHILRWGWRTRNSLKPVVPTLEHRFPGLTAVHLRHPSEARKWVDSLTCIIGPSV